MTGQARGYFGFGHPEAVGFTTGVCFLGHAVTLVGYMQTPLQPRKARMGCLTQVVLSLLLGVAAIFAIDAVFAPWSYFMGGNFHLIPMWQGWGRIHAPAGDYVLFVTMSPRTGSRGIAHVAGTGVLCTPRGDRKSVV